MLIILNKRPQDRLVVWMLCMSQNSYMTPNTWQRLKNNNKFSSETFFISHLQNSVTDSVSLNEFNSLDILMDNTILVHVLFQRHGFRRSVFDDDHSNSFYHSKDEGKEYTFPRHWLQPQSTSMLPL